jgi:hypothetical protein
MLLYGFDVILMGTSGSADSARLRRGRGDKSFKFRRKSVQQILYFFIVSFRYGLFNSVGRAPDAAGLHIGGRF